MEAGSTDQQSDELKKTMLMGSPTKEQTLEPEREPKGELRGEPTEEAKKGHRQASKVEPRGGKASPEGGAGSGPGAKAGAGAGVGVGPKTTLTGHVAQVNASPGASHEKPGSGKTREAQETLILGEELDKDDEAQKQETRVGRPASQSGDRRNTVLPKVVLEGSVAKLIHEQRERFEFLSALGSGAAGDVLLAHDKDVRRKVAIKTLKKEIHDPKLIGRFVEEIRTVGELEHPNIPPIHDVGINSEGQYFFVMKYMDGVTLTEIIRRLREGDQATHAVYTFEKRALIISEVCKALSFAHSRGFIHRDIKPDNIMIGRHGEVLLMDWGIAKRIDPESERIPFLDTVIEEGVPCGESDQHKRRSIETMQGSLLGTPFYMSPEQARAENEHLDQRSDIYSVCAVFHEFLTLRHYLSRYQSLEDVLKGVVEDEPDMAMMVSNPHQSRPPADLSHAVRKGMQKDPEKRYQSVEELIELLEKVRAGYLPIQCPFTFSKRTAFAPVHFVDKHPFMAIFLFALFGLGFIGMLINTIINLL